MAVTSHLYTRIFKSLIDKKADLDSDALKVMLLSAYTVGTTQDTAQFVADVKAVATEAVGTGYVAGGQALAGVSFLENGHVYALDCNDPAWDATGGTLSAAFAVFYDSTPGSDAANPVLGYWDLGGTQTASNGLFPLTINAAGLLTFTGA